MMKAIQMTPAAARQTLATTRLALPAVSQATAAHTAALIDLHTRCMGTAFDTVNREFSRMVAAPDKARRFIEDALNDQNASVMILRVGSRVVGYAVARPVYREIDGVPTRMPARLEAIGVLESERNQGYGRILLRNVARALGGIEIHTPVTHGFFAKVSQQDATGQAELVSVGAQGLMAPSRHMASYSLSVR